VDLVEKGARGLFRAEDYEVNCGITVKKKAFGQNTNSHNTLKNPDIGRRLFLPLLK